MVSGLSLRIPWVALLTKGSTVLNGNLHPPSSLVVNIHTRPAKPYANIVVRRKSPCRLESVLHIPLDRVEVTLPRSRILLLEPSLIKYGTRLKLILCRPSKARTGQSILQCVIRFR